uniref:Uncharacterized protein n=1 Tax=viral metagenome TaxID=1070528 RepID=A0A6H1ZDK3_9ZZZZ
MKHCLDRENGCNPYGDSCSCGCNICLKIPEPKYSEHFASYAQGERETITKVRKWIDDIKNGTYII